VLEAVLFDWGDTLMQFAYSPELVSAGHRAGLAALGKDGLPEVDALTEHFRERYEPLFWAPGTIEEIEYPGLVRQLLGDFDVEIDDDELGRYLEAEHAAWDPARLLAAHSHALLEALRESGLRLGLVSNAFDPGWLLHRDLEQMGLAERLDFSVFSSEVGIRKPHPAIFERALAALEVESAHALWFRADEHPEGGEPDYQAFTQMDVLNIARRLA
jgi:FMN phosphatase YigB (HAD superfamily)